MDGDSAFFYVAHLRGASNGDELSARKRLLGRAVLWKDFAIADADARLNLELFDCTARQAVCGKRAANQIIRRSWTALFRYRLSVFDAPSILWRGLAIL